MSLFDDLIPRASQQRADLFADLIPQEEEAPRLPDMDTGVPETAPVPLDMRTSSVSRRDGRMGLDQSIAPADRVSSVARRGDNVPEDKQPVSDLGKRTARGATEVIASVPEALGVMQSSGVEVRIDDTRSGLGVRQEQIDSITARLSDPTISDSERRMREQQLADLQEGQQAIAGQMETLQERASIPTQERPIFQLGDQIRNRSTEFFGAPDPQYDDRFASKLAEGGGSLLGFAGVTALTGWIGGGLTGAAVNSAQLYNEAIDYGATEEEARTAAAIGAAIGTTEVIPIGRALDRFAGKAKSRVSGALARRLVSAAETAGEEGIQEAATQIANNLTAAGIYDENREWSEGALEAATIGAILGGGLGALTPGPAAPPRSRDPEDRERMDSPRLTPSDRASPIPNDIIDDGKKAVDELLSGATPVTPLDEAAPNVRVPEADVVKRPLPTDRLSPTLGAAPQPDAAPRNLSEPLEDSQNPGRFVQIDFDTGQIVDAEAPRAAAVAPVTPEPAVPAQPQSRRLSEPMERTDAPGQTVQVDLDTGETVPTQQRTTDAQAAPEPAAEAPAADVAVPEVVDPAPAVQVEQPRRSAPERLKRRPLTDLLKAEGVQPGSPLATELAARGIDQRTTPGLFKAGGRADWDNLPVSEWSEFAPIIGDDGNGYLSRDGLIEAVENELRGQPVQVGEQARLQEARDLRNYMAEFDPEDMPPIDLSDIPEATITIPAIEEDISTDAERRQMVERSLGGVLQQTGLTEVLTASERAEIANALTSNGGNVEDMLWSVIRRSADSAEDPEFTGSQADAAPQDGGVEAEAAVQQSAGRPERDRGAEGRGDARQNDAGRDNGRAAEVDRDGRGYDAERTEGGFYPRIETPTGQRTIRERVYATREEANEAARQAKQTRDTTDQPATEQTDAGEQTLMPGVAPITERDRQRAEIERRQNSNLRGRDEGPGSGRDDLFGAPEDRRDLFDAPQSNGDQETSQNENNAVEAEPQVSAQPDQETPADLGRSAASAGNDRKPPADMSSQDMTAWLNAYDAEVSRMIEASKTESRDKGGKVIEGQPKVKVTEYKPAPDAPTLQEPQTAQTQPKIQDFGEKIGGARKDTATSTGPRGSRSSNDGQPGWRKRYAVIQNWDLKAGQADKDKWMILDKRTNKGVRDGYRTKLFDTEAEAEAAVPLYEVARNHKVYSNGDGGFAIHRLVSDRKRPVVKGGFETREEAMQYMAENPVEIIEFKTRIDDTIHPALEEAIRVGEERRAGGRDVVAEDFGDIFGFRGVEFGEWNNGAERQHILNQAYDALLDMAEIIRVSPRALSLNGEIGLAFGARGQGLSSARAHYEMDHAVINLTKIKGAGSLAHEWWHAVDHYLARIDGKASSERLEKTAKDKDGNEYTYWTFDAKGAKEDFASWGFLYKSGMREEMRDAIKGVMDAISKRKMEYTEDQSTRERIAKRRSGDIDKLLEQWRAGLATEQRYGRKTAPATDEQLKRFDAAADRIRKGDMGEMVNAPSKSRYSFRFYEPILEIAEINKEVRGRQSYGVQQNRLTGDAVRLQNAVDVRTQDQKFLEDAKAEKVKTKTVRSEFYSNAWAMDQGRVQNYWSTNHELSARAFEAFVYDRLKEIDARNDFLAYEKHNDLPEYRMFNAKPYPEGQERADINAAFEKLFDVIETKTADDGAVMMYQRPLDMFYSPLLKAVNSAKQKQAPAKDWKAIVAKLPGVKKAEMEWLGVEDWLDAQEGQVPREALVAFIRDSQIELVEDRLGERPESFAADFDTMRGDEAFEDWRDVDIEQEILAEAELDGTYIAPNFETYTEDGGENYREVLVRVPNLHKTGKNRLAADVSAQRAALEAEESRLRDLYNRERDDAVWDQRQKVNEKLLAFNAANVNPKSPFVQSAHFEQENIVVHARVKDRTGPNGERVLFVEEIQSDLASVWRENSEAPEITARRRELSALRYRLRDAIGDKSDELAERIKALHKEPGLTVGNISEDINSVTANLDRQYSNWKQYTLDLLRENEPDAMNELAALHREAESVQAELLALGTEKRMPEGTPDTPFKEEHTYNLMVKRLLRMAAEEGYDQLSWTPGYMQAERWNSAAQSVVEGVEWDSAEIPGYRYVTIQMASGGQTISASVEPSGRIEGSTSRDLEGKQLSALVGPGLAKQIMTEQSGRADNQKITFPDSGYAIAYDQQTKRAVDKLVKPYGTSVRVDKSLPDFEQGLGALINEAAKLPKDEILNRFDTMTADILSRSDQNMTEGRRRVQQETLDRRRQNLVRALDAGEASYGLQAFSDNDLKALFPEFAQSLSSPVWSVTITPELREAAMQPMPMFRRGDVRPDTKAAVWANLPELRAELDKMGLTDVDLRQVEPDPTYQGALRIDRKGGMTILIGASLDPEATLRHEAIHALSAMNLFKGGEWRLLTQRAQRDWMAKHDIEARYPDLSRLEQIEEAIAEEYAAWATSGGKEQIGAFAKIKRFLEALGNMLRGQGFQTVKDVFGSVSEGVVGRRDRGTATDGMRFQRPNPNAQGREAIARGTNTPAVPDRQVFDEALRENATIFARASGVKGALRDDLDSFRIRIQDRMLPLRRAEEAIAELTGGVIDKKDSAYFAEERYSGRVGFRLDKIRDEYTTPIARMIGNAGEKLSLTDPAGETLTGIDAVDLYLWARHAKERNARIAQINPSMGGPTLEDPYASGTGSGLSDAQADAIIQQAEKSMQRKTYRDIGAMADRLGQEMIQWREDAGLLSKEEAAIWRAMYRNYVPLRGFAETDMHDAIANEVQMPGGAGGRFSARGKESKRALGRSSKAYSPLSTMIAMAEEVTVRAEKNLVARTLYNLAEKYPAPAMWRVKSLETKRYFNSQTGTVETRVIDPASVMPKPNEVALKINGIEKRVELVDPRMAQAMSQLGTMEMGAVTRFASMFSRLFSATNTMLSPPFVIVNAFRDMVTAQINLGHLPKEMRGKVRTAAVRDWIKSFGGSYSEMRGGGTSDYAQYFREFSEVGAKVSFWQIENPEARNDSLRKAVRRESGGKLNRAFWKGATFDTDVNPVLNWIETVNLAVDNSVRLSVYVEGRRQGMSIEEAASLSKNLTVNFNRRGEWGATMNAWFPFANAAVQGSHVLVKAMKAPQVQALLGGAVLTGFAMELLNASLSERDDDDELAHDKIPDYISQRNLIIPTGGDTRVTIPLPYGYNVFFYAGQQMAKAMRGVKDEGQVIRDVTKATFGAFSPISGEGLAQTIMPTLGDHMMELATNKDWLGRPIRPESPYADYGPQAYKMFKNEPPVPFQMASDLLNRGTGGSPLEPGLIDVSPEYLHHTFKFLTGGAGRFVDQTVNLATRAVQGDLDLVEAHQVPLVRTLRYQPSEFLDQGRYFEFRNNVNNARAMVEKRAPELGIDPTDRLVKTASLYPQLRAAERQRRNISEQIDAIYADRSLSYRERRERLAPLEDRRSEVYIRFNRAYVDTLGPQSE